jgi:3-demethylubiquinone-9 3-methyltransferase
VTGVHRSSILERHRGQRWTRESERGWCKDRWGINWQITPRTLTEALACGGDEAVMPFGRRKTVNQNRPVRRFVVAAIATLGMGAAAAVPPAPAGHQPGQEAEVLAAVDRYLHAISTNDLKAMAAMQMPDGMTYLAIARKEAGMEIVGRPNSYWINPLRDDGRVVRERYWSPTVLIRGSIAVVWAPYEFWEDGKTSHCGVDVIDLVRIDDAWRVANSMWTVEPEACAELRPADPEAIRPKEPRKE